jgi:alpha-tubulin suppressor-like RCC1 family protein
VRFLISLFFSVSILLTLTGCLEWWVALAKAQSPVAVLLDAPSDVSAIQKLDVGVAGDSVTGYRYKIGLAATTDCTNPVGYSESVTAAGIPISDNLQPYADQFVNLCVVAVSASGRQQSPANSSTVRWYVDSTPSTVSLVEVEQSALESDSTVKSFTLNLSVAKPYPLTVTYALSGDAVPGLDHNLASSSVIVIPPNTLTYALPFRIFLNPFSNVSKEMLFKLQSTNREKVGISPRDLSRFIIYDTDGGVRPTVTDFTTDGMTTCAVLSNGVLKCWGVNTVGQVGDGSTVNRGAPVVVDSGVTYSTVRTHGKTTCGITTVGVLKCWGANAFNQLANGGTVDSGTPTVIDAGTAYSMVVPGTRMCALTTTGILKCWGENTNGKVGNGVTTTVPAPVAIGAALRFATIVASDTNTCAITTSGTGSALYCWGAGANGQVGNGGIVDVLSTALITGGTAYASVAIGSNATCAITTVGSLLKCWGAANAVGDGGTTRRTSPVAIDGVTTYSMVSLASGATCGITTAGVLKCWAANTQAQLGDGTTTARLSPVVIDSGVLYSSVYIGANTVCGITTANNLKCWGYDVNGTVGVPVVNPTDTYIATPTIVDAGVTYSAVQTAGSSANGTGLTCGVTTVGKMKCWGESTIGQTGDGIATAQLTPETIDAGTTYKQIDSNNATTCGITSSDKLKCWGTNSAGQVGDGTVTDKKVPVAIDSATSYRAVYMSGYNSNCAITTDDVLKCWGANSAGQLGDGTKTASLVPKVVDSSTRYSQLVLASSSLCGITTAGILKCWGANGSGQVGNGTTTEQLTPQVIDTGTLYQNIVMASNTVCGITTAKVLKCWGSNSSGEVGVGSTLNVLSPTVIDAGVLYKQVVTNNGTTCALTDGGAVKCWGSNIFTQVGNGLSASQYTTPQAVDAMTVYSRVYTRGFSSFGITTAGALKAWGFNTSAGQLGDGSLTNRSTPVAIDVASTYADVRAQFHTCAITTSGVLKCWGDNTFGQVGVNTVGTQATPTVVDSGVAYSFVLPVSNSVYALTTAGVLKAWGRNSTGQLGNGGSLYPVAPRDITKWLTP